ncbi:EutN/CcmL family microcompartment protein [Ruminococcus gauvreauii]|uniref:EutN/CcmL family microcompartment protein n=1 Tax=Ruminococcus gauvreauii TaxID=438033 RepID=UPI00048CF0A3|nr:EutN/CcmL family microcompartment protein [Ruminococcus gauvreauii]
MKTGIVIGNVWATRKEERLLGYKLLLVRPIDMTDQSLKETPVVVIDTIGAGMGETVIFVSGSSARSMARESDAPVDAAVVGIVDGQEIDETEGKGCFRN